jgi:hypothetical protein
MWKAYDARSGSHPNGIYRLATCEMDRRDTQWLPARRVK